MSRGVPWVFVFSILVLLHPGRADEFYARAWTTQEDTPLMADASRASDLILSLPKGAPIDVLDRNESWCEARTASGKLGYIESKFLDWRPRAASITPTPEPTPEPVPAKRARALAIYVDEEKATDAPDSAKAHKPEIDKPGTARNRKPEQNPALRLARKRTREFRNPRFFMFGPKTPPPPEPIQAIDEIASQLDADDLEAFLRQGRLGEHWDKVYR